MISILPAALPRPATTAAVAGQLALRATDHAREAMVSVIHRGELERAGAVVLEGPNLLPGEAAFVWWQALGKATELRLHGHGSKFPEEEERQTSLARGTEPESECLAMVSWRAR
jgi:hypothetical protein